MRQFVAPTQIGQPVEPDRPGTVAHTYAGPDGSLVVVVRDARGRLLPGSRLVLLRAGAGGPATSPYSVVRRALGIETKWDAHARRKREREEG